jgi:uncharacterized protein YciI
MEKRTPYRPKHLEAANNEVEKGNIIMAGAYPDSPYGAVFVFSPKSDRNSIEAFVKKDPYFLNQLVKEYCIREWMVPVLTPKLK